MDPGRRRVLDAFPYPVTYPYALIFDEREGPRIVAGPSVAPSTSSCAWCACRSSTSICMRKSTPTPGTASPP